MEKCLKETIELLKDLNPLLIEATEWVPVIVGAFRKALSHAIKILQAVESAGKEFPKVFIIVQTDTLNLDLHSAKIKLEDGEFIQSKYMALPNLLLWVLDFYKSQSTPILAKYKLRIEELETKFICSGCGGSVPSKDNEYSCYCKEETLKSELQAFKERVAELLELKEDLEQELQANKPSVEELVEIIRDKIRWSPYGKSNYTMLVSFEETANAIHDYKRGKYE